MSKPTGAGFREAIDQRAKKNQTRAILALDLAETLPPEATAAQRQDLADRACKLARAVAPHLAAIKINYPLTLGAGLQVIPLLKTAVPGIPLIADFKVADIDNTNAWIARHAYGAGVDAIIVHGFVGTDAVQGVLQEAHKFGDRGVILVVDMSHPGAAEFIHPQTPRLAQIALSLGVTGVIAPGTRPAHVAQIRAWIGPGVLIFAPGMGAQGGQAGTAIAAGADYEIFGRAIYQAADPVAAALGFAKATHEAATAQKKGAKPSRGPVAAPLAEDAAIVQKVALLLDEVKALQFGSFTLASGATSPYYIDLRLVPSHPSAFGRLVDLLVDYLMIHPDIQFDRIAGIPTAGISFATLLAHRLNKPLLYVRTAPKEHGRGRLVEGVLNPGDRVLVVDDLITDGGSKIEPVRSLRAEGAKVNDVLVVLDREQGGGAQLRQEQLQLRALAPITAVIKVLRTADRLSEAKAQGILDYIDEQRPHS
jgi:orotate phosphoribosyltransferase/orotidine 5'-phosphate decarboxylase subfamily 1